MGINYLLFKKCENSFIRYRIASSLKLRPVGIEDVGLSGMAPTAHSYNHALVIIEVVCDDEKDES